MLLVTGITGHTGKYFIEELKNNNYNGKIRCIVRNNSNIDCLKKSGLNYELAYGDLNDIEFLKKACLNVDEILSIYDIHFSLKILEAALSSNVKWIIFVHTTGIFSKYKMASKGYKKIENEVIQKSKDKVDITILRPTMIYGNLCDSNMCKFIKMIDKMKIYPMITGGRAKIQPVNARDLGKAYYQVLMNPENTKNRCYNLSGQKEVRIKEMLKMIGKDLNKKTIFMNVPMWLSLLCAYILKFFSFGKFDIVEKVLRMDEDRIFSHDDATKDFGYNPMKFEEGLKIEVNQYIQQIK